jgi:Ca2+/Na+ antiporter
MKTLGAILIITGFLLGVLTGIRFSTRSVIISDAGQVKQDKQMQVSIIGSLSVFMVLGGVYLFFCSE